MSASGIFGEERAQQVVEVGRIALADEVLRQRVNNARQQLRRNVSYVCGCGDDFIHRMEDFHGNLVQRVERVEEIGEDILKIAVFCPNGLDQPKKLLGPRWGRPYHMAEAGPEWLGFTLADKGKGLRGLCTALGVDLSETVAFGDNWNDAPMLEAAGIGYLMAGAAPALREKFPNQCASVLTVLENILKEIGA